MYALCTCHCISMYGPVERCPALNKNLPLQGTALATHMHSGLLTGALAHVQHPLRPQCKPYFRGVLLSCRSHFVHSFLVGNPLRMCDSESRESQLYFAKDHKYSVTVTFTLTQPYSQS